MRMITVTFIILIFSVTVPAQSFITFEECFDVLANIDAKTFGSVLFFTPEYVTKSFAVEKRPLNEYWQRMMPFFPEKYYNDIIYLLRVSNINFKWEHHLSDLSPSSDVSDEERKKEWKRLQTKRVQNRFFAVRMPPPQLDRKQLMTYQGKTIVELNEENKAWYAFYDDATGCLIISDLPKLLHSYIEISLARRLNTHLLLDRPFINDTRLYSFIHLKSSRFKSQFSLKLKLSERLPALPRYEISGLILSSDGNNTREYRIYYSNEREAELCAELKKEKFTSLQINNSFPPVNINQEGNVVVTRYRTKDVIDSEIYTKENIKRIDERRRRIHKAIEEGRKLNPNTGGFYEK